MPSMLVSGAGTSAVNGLYIQTGTVNGRAYYNKSGTASNQHAISWEVSGVGEWGIFGASGSPPYYSTDDVATPDLVTTWTVNGFGGGSGPAPTVTSITLLDTGWLDLTSFSSVGGSNAWTNPSNAASSNNTYAAEATVSTTASDNTYLQAVDLASNVPTGATIYGIETRIEAGRSAGAATINFDTVQLIIAGTKSGSNLASGSIASGSEAYYSFGGANNLWGLTPTDSDVNNANFGIALRIVRSGPTALSVNVDHMQMKVYYTGGSAGPTLPIFIHHYAQQGTM